MAIEAYELPQRQPMAGRPARRGSRPGERPVLRPALRLVEAGDARTAHRPAAPTHRLAAPTHRAVSPPRRHARGVYARRRLAALALLVLAAVALVAPLRSEAAPAFEPEPAIVVVGHGDTLWDLAWPYLPVGEDLRAYVLEVAAENGITPGRLRPGMVVRFPQR